MANRLGNPAQQFAAPLNPGAGLGSPVPGVMTQSPAPAAPGIQAALEFLNATIARLGQANRVLADRLTPVANQSECADESPAPSPYFGDSGVVRAIVAYAELVGREADFVLRLTQSLEV